MKKLWFLFSLLIFILPLVQAHVVPVSNLYIENDSNKLFLQVDVQVMCYDVDCLDYLIYDYNVENFNNNLTITQNGSECAPDPNSFSKFVNDSNLLETYYINYTCPNTITSLDILNSLFYETRGYYFEQYYILNCSNKIKFIYTDLTVPEITYNPKEICSSDKESFNGFATNITNTAKNSVLQVTDKTTYLFNKVVDLSKSNNFLVLFIFFSFLLGIIHSFSPGHGKSLIVSYIIGHKATRKDILLLAFTTAFVHVLDVLILSLIFYFLPFSLKSKYVDLVTLLAAVLIMLFGIRFFINSIRNKHDHSHDHMHVHEHSHEYMHAHNIEHSHHHSNVLTHTHEHKKKSILSMGILAGLAPCPTAWLLFSVLISLKLYSQAVISLVAFSVGLISTILFVSIIFLKFKPLLKFIPEEFKGYSILKIASSILITIIGIIMLIRVISLGTLF